MNMDKIQQAHFMRDLTWAVESAEKIAGNFPQNGRALKWL